MIDDLSVAIAFTETGLPLYPLDELTNLNSLTKKKKKKKRKAKEKKEEEEIIFTISSSTRVP